MAEASEDDAKIGKDLGYYTDVVHHRQLYQGCLPFFGAMGGKSFNL